MLSRPVRSHERLVLALDVPDTGAAERLVLATDGVVGVYKIGFELALSGGLGLAQELVRDGHQVFLDMKLLDIPNTVARAVESAARLGVRYLTVHAYPQALAAAVAVPRDGLAIVGVTVLTSLDDADLTAAGYASAAGALVNQRLGLAAELGADAVVCSPEEAAAARRAGLSAITPGVRLIKDTADDQKRIATPQEAIGAGADLIVVGRPISRAADPRAACEAYVAAIAEGLSSGNAPAVTANDQAVST